MLNAILHGKGRRLPPGVMEGESLKKLITGSEDALTSTVFERLAYLEGPVLWQILDATFQPKFLPPRSIVELIDVEFWPRWGQAKETLGQAVEPDVVLRLSAGDPAQTWVLIVECKLGGGIQSHDQWVREWIASPDSKKDCETWLLALGGLLPAGPKATVSRLSENADRDYKVSLKVAAAEWQDLLRALNEVKVQSRAGRRVVADIRQALGLYGFWKTRPMSELADIAASHCFNWQHHSWLHWPEEVKVAPLIKDNLVSWAEKSSSFRPISCQHLRMWKDDDV